MLSALSLLFRNTGELRQNLRLYETAAAHSQAVELPGCQPE